MEKYTKDAGSENKLMKNDLSIGVFPSTELLKARLLFDGGYYAKSLAILIKIKPETLHSNFQKLELEYRYARIYQEEKKYSEAIDHYKKSMQVGLKINSYLVPNSCLQLGQIYEQLNYLALARTYYEKVLDYSNFDYESSIHQKAKSNLLRIK